MQFLLRRSLRRFSRPRCFSSTESTTTEGKGQTRLGRELSQMIRFSGPIPVAQYMREVLSNPVSGYYAAHHKTEAFVSDFITSPQVSQMFGESLGIWLANEWAKMGAPRPFQLVEFGPGTGALMKDILRALEGILKTKHLSEIISLHLIEISPNLRKLQKVQLTDPSKIKSDVTSSGIPIYWHRSLDTLPRSFSMIIAHEFFDTLPVHQFVKNDEGSWREILVDILPEDDERLRFVLARNETPALSLIRPQEETRSALEISPDSLLLTNQLSSRISEDGGACLIVDYGHNGDSQNGLSLRAFRRHALLENALVSPGHADVTANVDYSQLRAQCPPDRTLTFGPVRQCEVLEALGMRLRKERLQEASNETVAAIIEENYETLTHPDKMGNKFKFFSIFPKTMEDILKKYPPIGFHMK